MIFKKRDKLDARLPATPCTQDMMKRVKAVAKQEKVTVAEVQRNALSLFLSEIDRKSVSDDIISVNSIEEKAS